MLGLGFVFGKADPVFCTNKTNRITLSSNVPRFSLIKKNNFKYVKYFKHFKYKGS